MRVGDCFGMTFERIQGKKSLARICADEPSRIIETASLLATEGKQLHTTPCDTAFFPSRKEQTLTAIDVAPFVDETDKQKMRSFVEGLADALSELRDTFAYREFENLINQVFSSKRPNDQEYELST